jgi:signal transduction histidine kinase
MPRSALDLRALVADVATELRPLAEARHVRIQTLSGGDPAFISGNPQALRRLFVILLDNALKYSPEGGEVRLRLSRESGPNLDKRVSVSIEDSGTGISPTDLPHIFERFYRASDVRAVGVRAGDDAAGGDGRAGEGLAGEGTNKGQNPEGHGIGLALADHIARAHGAQIEVRSTEGSSVFRVTFAAYASANPQIAAIM